MKLIKLTAEHPNRPLVIEYVLPEDRAGFEDYHWHATKAEEVEACGYGVGAGWHPARCGSAIPCAMHADLKCLCGDPATEACSNASQFVCGYPACNAHKGNCGRHGR